MPGDIGRYRIDYILVKQRFRNLHSVKPEPVSPLTRISLNVQTKAQLKISRIRKQSNPQNTKTQPNLNKNHHTSTEH